MVSNTGNRRCKNHKDGADIDPKAPGSAVEGAGKFARTYHALRSCSAARLSLVHTALAFGQWTKAQCSTKGVVAADCQKPTEPTNPIENSRWRRVTADVRKKTGSRTALFFRRDLANFGKTLKIEIAELQMNKDKRRQPGPCHAHKRSGFCSAEHFNFSFESSRGVEVGDALDIATDCSTNTRVRFEPQHIVGYVKLCTNRSRCKSSFNTGSPRSS